MNISFTPMLGIERFMDLRQSVIFATAPVTEILAKGYLGYFEQFAAGSYKMKPVIVNAGIDTPKGPHIVSTEEPVDVPVEKPIMMSPEVVTETMPSSI